MDFLGELFSDLEFKADSDVSGEFSGYGAYFGNVDQGKDICVKGCFADALKGGELPLMFWMHDKSEPIGQYFSAVEDDRGLRVQGKLWLGKGIPRAEQAYQLLRAKQGGLSIGYTKQAEKFDSKAGVNHLLKINPKEVSIVTFPMNPKARVDAVKTESALDPEVSRMLTAFKAENEKAAIDSIRHNLRDGTRRFMSLNQYLRGNAAPKPGESVTLA